jgi:hypothetical protein
VRIASSGGSVGSLIVGPSCGDPATLFNSENICVGCGGDGTLTLTIPAAPGQPGALVILLNNGSGGFMSSPTITVGVDPSAVAAGLLDQGGTLDLAVAHADDDDAPCSSTRATAPSRPAIPPRTSPSARASETSPRQPARQHRQRARRGRPGQRQRRRRGGRRRPGRGHRRRG